MSTGSRDGIVPVRPEGAQLQTLQAQNAWLRDALNEQTVIEQAKGAISARQGTTPDVAFELLRGLALSQRRDLHEYAAAVVEGGGRLDV
jgi:AmiR/NasT family two-component response regulator